MIGTRKRLFACLLLTEQTRIPLDAHSSSGHAGHQQQQPGGCE
jgi:hypothetical protein